MERRVSTEREILEAETKLAESRIAVSRAAQRLRNLGLTDAQIQEAARKNDTSSRLSLTVPFAGIVVERSAVIGEVVIGRLLLLRSNRRAVRRQGRSRRGK